MKMYYVNGLDNKNVYKKFIRIMLCYSDAFSLVFFKKNESEKAKCSVKKIQKSLAPYKIYSQNVSKWPGTNIVNLQKHIYRLFLYRSDNADWSVIDALETANSIWDWNYPNLPMDLSFYRKGYAWFISTAHEHINQLYLSEEAKKSFLSISDLESVGIELIYKKDVEDSKVYYDKKAKYPFAK